MVKTQALVTSVTLQQVSSQPRPLPDLVTGCQPPPGLAPEVRVALATEALEDRGPGLRSLHGQTEVILSDAALGGVAPLLGVVTLQTRARPHTQLPRAPVFIFCVMLCGVQRLGSTKR